MVERAARLWRRLDSSLRPISGEDPTLIYRLAICLWVGFAVAVSVKMVVSPLDHNNYVNFENGGRAWWTDGSLYTVGEVDFRYLPPFAVAVSPLAMLPSALGALVWIWLNLALFFWSLRVLVRDVFPQRMTATQEGAFLLLSLVGAVRVFWCAQTNLLVFALVVFAMSAILAQRWTWAALLLALPIYIKAWPVAAALLLIACWPRQLSWRFASAMVVVGAAPLLTRSWSFVVEQYSNWYRAFIGPMQIRHVYRDAWTVWDLIHKPVDERAYLALQLISAVFVLVLVKWRQRRKASDQQLLVFILGMWTCWQLTFGPGVERATFGLIAPVTAWAMITSKQQRFGISAILLAAGLTFLATFGELERALMDTYPIVQIAHPLGVAIIGCWLVAFAQREVAPWRRHEPTRAATARGRRTVEPFGVDFRQQNAKLG